MKKRLVAAMPYANRVWRRRAGLASEKLGVPGPCPGFCGKTLDSHMTLVKRGSGPWTCEACDGRVFDPMMQPHICEHGRSQLPGDIACKICSGEAEA